MRGTEAMLLPPYHYNPTHPKHYPTQPHPQNNLNMPPKKSGAGKKKAPTAYNVSRAHLERIKTRHNLLTRPEAHHHLAPPLARSTRL